LIENKLSWDKLLNCVTSTHFNEFETEQEANNNNFRVYNLKSQFLIKAKIGDQQEAATHKPIFFFVLQTTIMQIAKYLINIKCIFNRLLLN